MTQEDIIRMARKAGIAKYGLGIWEGQLERFAALAFAAGADAEREACAKVCEEIKGVKLQGYEFAAAIRVRGQ